MAFRPVVLDAPPGGVSGRLWLSSMPGRFESWREFIAEANARELALVVSLAPREEIAELSPPYFRALAQGKLPFRWLNLPMQNFGLPADADGFRTGIEQVGASLRRGDAVLLHCAAGLGRTGTAAACLLKHLGLPTSEALQRIRDAGSNPQTAEQSGLIGLF
jgi:protein-tyrosine phosphatase